MTQRHVGVVLMVLTATLACAAPAPDPGPDPEADRAALREADGRYSAAAQARDMEAVPALYTTDAVAYPPGEGTIRGLDAIRAYVEAFSSNPNITFSFRPEVAEVSGDLGYTINMVTVSLPDSAGNMTSEALRDVHIWRRQADGSWKIILDTWNVEPPAGASPG